MNTDMTTDGRPWVEWSPAIPAQRPATGARVRHEYAYNANFGRYFVHPDDAPDPDADLIERMAGTIGGQFSCSGEPVVSNVYREVARAVLAVVRESGAVTR